MALVLLGAIAWWGLGPAHTSGEIAPRQGWTILRPPHDVNALAEHAGKIWAGGRDGLALLDPKSGAVLPLPDGTPDMGYVKALLIDRAGRLWVGHRTGLARFDGVNWWRIAVSPTAPPGPVTALVETQDGRILVGGEAGLAALSNAGLAPVDMPDGQAGRAVLALFEDAGARLWVGLSSASLGGLLVEAGGTWRALGRDDGLAHLRVNHITQDREGRIWLATGFGQQGGACASDRSGNRDSWRCIGARDGLASDMVRLVFEDRHGQFWFGTEFDGAAVVLAERSLRLARADGLSGFELKAMLEDSLGNLWLGSDKGLTRIDATATALFPADPTKPKGGRE
ncbi:hypothetical protein GCM10011358_06590 [Sinisalibacter lacisalsi]|uniref:Histidine kinase n=1 Tax=Sinisalibacter lacisalsi TaxID=1526570 RepID=A0ABQ1QEC5_9RHOB|nr:hypothetical protein GCM10011358_06590 [Sinisalibacter lacisalsi]